MRLHALIVFVSFVLSIAGCAGGIARVNYQPELTTNNIHMPERVGLYMSQDVREFMDKRWGLTFDVGPQLVVETEKNFRVSFAELRVLQNFPPLPREAQGLDAVIVFDKPESTVHRVRTFGYLAHLTVPVSVYTPDGKKLLGAYKSESKVDFEMGAVNPTVNIEISRQAMRIAISGATVNFLRQYSGTEPPILAVGETMTGTAQARSSFKAARLSRSAPKNLGAEKVSRAPEVSRAFKPASGLYALEQSITFNVLDKVVFDDETGQVTLIGHYDNGFEGPRIPYLQHLATLLESSRPKFSLEWTKDSEVRTDALFRRMDSMEEMRKVVEKWTEWIGPDGKLTVQGRVMLPLFGVRPTENGKSPGYLGVRVKLIKPKSYGSKLPITQIVPNSPAQKAGLRIGDEIIFIGNQRPYHPIEVKRFVRRIGTGANTRIRILRPGIGEKNINVKLGTGSGDPWDDLSRFDILVQIFKAAEMKEVSWTLYEYNRLQYLIDTPVGIIVVWDIIMSTGNYNKVRQMQNQLKRGALSRYEFNKKLFRSILEGTDRKLRMTQLTSSYDIALGRGLSPEDAFDVAYTSLNQQIKPVLREAMQRLLKKQDEIVMPVSMVESTLGMAPMVVPTYIGVDRNSQLARVMFEADYLGKFMTHMPELKDSVPGYQTEYAYYRKNGVKGGASGTGSAHHYRMWISVGSIDMAQSLGGNTLEIRDLKMRFNIRDVGGGESPSAVGGYERLLTSLYDGFSREYHVLHELREAAKLAAVSQWIKSKRPDFRLPRNGQLRWQGPDRLPGVVNLIWSPNSIKVTMTAMGGVSLVPPIGPGEPKGWVAPLQVVRDSSVVELKGSTLTVVPQSFDNQTLRQILRKKTVVPVPRPAGWVARATKGERTLQALTVRNPDPSRCDAEQSIVLSQKLENAKKKAMQLKVVEDSINNINLKSPDKQREFAEVNSMLTAARDEYIKTSIDMLTQGVSGAYDVLKKDLNVKDFETMKQSIKLIHDAKGFISEIKGKIDKIELAYRAATADDIESRNKAVRDLLDLTKELMSSAKFRGNDPLSRAFRSASKTLGSAARYKDALSLGQNLIDLGEGMIRLKDADKLTEQELQDLTDKLLPMQRRLSDQLDDIMHDPAVQDWLSNKPNIDC